MSRNDFASLGVRPDLVASLDARGITAPFPIQSATLTDALAGRDICGRAPTGSGKTLAFALTIAMRTQRAKPKRPKALVLVPTRELAAQVQREITSLGSPLRVAPVYGGVGYGAQRAALRRGVDVLVACPGRLEDLIQQGDISLSDVRIVVIDEADRMADMGFLPAVRRLVDQTNADRQTLLFSATLDGDVDVIVKRYQRDPVRHEVSTPEDEQGEVEHLFWRVERDQRVDVTARLINHHGSAVVFCRTRHGADRVTKQLARAGVEAAAIHGSRSQPQRDRALEAFSSGGVKALIATDVAARGIHVDDVSCVVHFDPPTTDKDYVHRSGRTGRAGADGTVVSLVGSENAKAVRDLQRALRLPLQVDAPDAALVGSLPKAVARPSRPGPRTHGQDRAPRRNRRGGGRRGETR